MKYQILCAVMISLLVGCREKEPVQPAKVVPTSETQTNTIKKAVIQIPQHLHPLRGVVTYTRQIGTSDHPTIDGGIINTTENIPASPVESQHSATEKTVSLPFQDNWATNATVKQMLQAASHGGKLAYVLEKSETMQLPASVAIVPMVESHYNPKAISQKGAAGAWQLMPATAKDYGLSSNERFEFETETDAALTLLKDLYHEFSNWELTFAAYNAGSQRVKDAIKKNPRAMTVDALDLPSETKIYVKRLIALNQKLMEGVQHA